MDFNKIVIGDISINRSSSTKYLGVILDEKLSWEHHVNYICQSLLKYFGIFNRIKHFVTQKLSRQLYFAFIYSRISYAIEVYGTCSSNLLSKIQVLQNKLLKLLLCKPFRTPTNDIHSGLNVIKVKDIYLCNLLTFVNKCLMGNCPDMFNTYFSVRDVIYNLRQQPLHVPRFRTTMGSLSTKIQGAKLWNKHHEIVHNIAMRKSFKHNLTKYLINQYK